MDGPRTIGPQLVHLLEPEGRQASVRIDQIFVWTVRPSIVAEHALPERHDPAPVGRARDDREALDRRWVGGEPHLAASYRDRLCLVEVALQEALYPTLTTSLATLHYQGPAAVRQGNRNAVLAPYSQFETRDGHVMLMCMNDEHWRRLVTAMGREELADDARFAKNKARMQNLAETEAVVEAWTRAHTRNEVFDTAKRIGVPAAAVRSLAEVMHDAHMHERGMLCTVDHPDLGPIVLPTSPIRYDEARPPALIPSPRLGAHNAEVYATWLGLSSPELEALRADGVI